MDRWAEPSSLGGWRPTPWGDKVCCICRQPCPTSGPPTGIRSGLKVEYLLLLMNSAWLSKVCLLCSTKNKLFLRFHPIFPRRIETQSICRVEILLTVAYSKCDGTRL